jgi:hypothetical protein
MLVVMRSARLGRRAEESDLLAIDAAPSAEQEVKAQAETLDRRERPVKRD